MWVSLSVIVIAYLLGSLASAILVCRLLGLPDPREQGSGNPGTTNVLRIGGKPAAALTLLGDVLKGLSAVYLAMAIDAEAYAVAGAGLAAFLGHLYPLFFGFRGGKGVATAFGAGLGLAPWAALAALATWLLIAALTRLSSLAALSAALLMPVYLWLLRTPVEYLIAAVLMAVLLIWRHRGNMRRLLNGSERRIGMKS